MEHDFKAIFDCFISIGTCFLLSVAYLASLHIWNSPYNRDHPSTIKKRFTSVFFMLFIAPCFLYAVLDKSILQKESFIEVLGLKTKGLLQASCIPLLLTMVLFLGPISMEILNSITKEYKSVEEKEPTWNLIWLRNHIVAPFSEEFTYRSCMMPLLLQCLPPMTAVFVNPLLFGVAHFHHMQERMKFGMEFNTALKIACFQFMYTTIFGAYSAYLFYRTGHFVSIFIVHAFCNHMGFPNIIEVASYGKGKRTIISFLFVVGFVMWCVLLKPLTEPTWFYNEPTWYKV